MKSKIYLAVTIALFALSSNAQVKKTPKAGAGKDAHGCVASAGYTYSKLKKDCIRVFEQKIQLKEVAPTTSHSSIAGVIFSDDNTTVEVFVPSEKDSQLLKRTGKKGSYVWKNTKYSFSGTKSYTLLKGDKVIFKS